MPQRLFLLLSVLFFAASALAATDPDPREAVARAYLKTLEAMDHEAQATFYTAESVFEDPTSELFGEPWHFQGPEAITGFWRDSATDAGTLEIRNTIHRLYVTGPYVVVEFDSWVRNRGELIGFPDREFEGTIQVTTILRIEEGKVIHHLDHADYEGAWEQMNAIKARFEAEAAAAGRTSRD